MAEKIKELVLAPDSQTIVERELIVQLLSFLKEIYPECKNQTYYIVATDVIMRLARVERTTRHMHINGVKSLLILINRKAV